MQKFSTVTLQWILFSRLSMNYCETLVYKFRWRAIQWIPWTKSLLLLLFLLLLLLPLILLLSSSSWGEHYHHHHHYWYHIIINHYYWINSMWTYCKAKCCRAFGQTGNDCRKKNNIMLTFYYNHNIKIWLQLAICSKVLLIIGNALTFIVSPSHLDFAEIC